MNSFSTIDRPCESESHGTWNHSRWCHTPHPHEPEASDVTSLFGRCEGGDRKEMPFHFLMNALHHASQRGTLHSGEWELDCVVDGSLNEVDPTCASERSLLL